MGINILFHSALLTEGCAGITITDDDSYDICLYIYAPLTMSEITGVLPDSSCAHKRLFCARLKWLLGNVCKLFRVPIFTL